MFCIIEMGFMGHCLSVSFVCTCACACVTVCVCFRSTDLFPHREDGLCLIREERLRVRQWDGHMRVERRANLNKKKKVWKDRATRSGRESLEECVYLGSVLLHSSFIMTASRSSRGEYEGFFWFTHRKQTCRTPTSLHGVCHNPSLDYGLIESRGRVWAFEV